MFQTNTNRLVQLLVVVALIVLGIQPALASTSDGPELPPQCESIGVDEGHKLALHVYARGVQIYKWNATTQAWVFDAPRASLFAEENYFGEVGSHYRGPSWESKSGSKVVATRVPGTGCAPDPSAVAWLKLVSTENNGPGIFKGITYIQRVNTVGGLPPSTPGSVDGEVKEVPYTAEYYFYRAQN